MTTEVSASLNIAYHKDTCSPGISIDIKVCISVRDRLQVCRLQLESFKYFSTCVKYFLLGPQHVLGADPLLELVLGEVAEGDGLLLERGAVPVRRLGDLGRLVVADVGVERRHQHQGLVQQPADLLPGKYLTLYKNIC